MDARQEILTLIAEALQARGNLYEPGGAEAVAITILERFERGCPECRRAPREICRACGAGTGASRP
jgi:hypothetical protein